MKIAKYFALIGFTLLFFFRSMSQVVVKNILINDIDDYNQRDTLIIKHGFSEIYLYACPANQNIKDSCILYARKKFDNNGNLIEFVKGDDIAKNEIDYAIRYSKFSDSVFESTVTYPLSSKKIPDEIFTDTTIKGKSKKICLYKKDKNNNIIIRSHYKISIDGDIIEIDRYDLDDKFVQIFYPLGNRKPRKKWSDTLNLYGNKMIVHTEIFEENLINTRNIFDAKNKLLESSFTNSNLDNQFSSSKKQMFIYDDQNRLVDKIIVNEDNEFLSEEKFYYTGGVMRRYTMQQSPQDTMMMKEQRFDENERLIFNQSRSIHSKHVNTWIYFYDERGLRKRDEYYLSGVLQSSRAYQYK